MAGPTRMATRRFTGFMTALSTSIGRRMTPLLVQSIRHRDFCPSSRLGGGTRRHGVVAFLGCLGTTQRTHMDTKRSDCSATFLKRMWSGLTSNSASCEPPFAERKAPNALHPRTCSTPLTPSGDSDLFSVMGMTPILKSGVQKAPQERESENNTILALFIKDTTTSTETAYKIS